MDAVEKGLKRKFSIIPLLFLIQHNTIKQPL
jgi:hypothetical protein